ncbi:unnamed protein product [Fusarium venenatum]|uniref:Uncharacterized protein n=1 Tax=Fusarium venenatum TaxID=56646 RepID=A0A2L2T6N3_9HYPO|nr:uncharacterized protein FVRRES_01871 [Fusarium venenatum]CEI65359.1 unnamed protein product [Fusarium venenatum]
MSKETEGPRQLRQGPAIGRRFDNLTPVVCEITSRSLVIITQDSTYEKSGGVSFSLIVSQSLYTPWHSNLRDLPRFISLS